MREFSVPPVVPVADPTTLTDPVWDNAERSPDTVQFLRRTADGVGWSEVTCARFRDDVLALARGLVAAGVAAGDRVAIMSRTRYEWTLVDYAVWTCGGVTVPIYETSSADQVEWILTNSGAAHCVVETADHRATAEAVRPATLRNLWQIDGGDGGDGGDLDRLVADGESIPAADVEARRSAATGADVATIIYTSGTTGRPKGCTLTHHNLYTDTVNAIPGLSQLFREGGTTMLFLPLAHSFARMIQIAVVVARVTMAHTWDVRNLAADLKSVRPTFILSVPRVFEKVYNTAKNTAHAGGKGPIFDKAETVAVAYSEALDGKGPGLVLKAQHAVFDKLVYGKLRAALGGRCAAAISGGAPLGSRLAHFFRGIGVTIYEGYGLTETSPAVAANLQNHLKVGTVGRPLPGVTVRIEDDGEILVSGDLVFQGYWNDPAATAEVLVDGWYRTGDLGSLDDDGYLTITGRKKELIVTAGGKNVAPAVLEDRVRAHPLVSQCLVVGDRRPFVAALVTVDEEAFVTWKEKHGKAAEATVADLRDDADLRAEVQAAVDEANRAVSKAESVRVFTILPADFTEANGMLTPSMKVKRSIVAKEYADEIAALYH